MPLFPEKSKRQDAASTSQTALKLAPFAAAPNPECPASPGRRNFGPPRPLRARLSPVLPALALAAVCAGLPASSSAQQIANPGFEKPSVLQAGKPFLVSPDAALQDAGWAFGLCTGISSQNVAYADGIDAAEGTQVGFLQGDARDTEVPPGTPVDLCGIDITGLKADLEYDLSWAEASRASDASYGALTVILTDPENPGVRVTLVNREPVTNKGEWKRQTQRFTATGPKMRINILHSIPEWGGDAAGGESTIIDDFKIQPASAAK